MHTKQNIEPLRFTHMLWLHAVLLDLITHIYIYIYVFSHMSVLATCYNFHTECIYNCKACQFVKIVIKIENKCKKS